MFVCPNGCKPHDLYGNPIDTPFMYRPCCLFDGTGNPPELGVLIYPDLSPSNRWEDGTVGVPIDVIEALEAHDCLPDCIECGEEVVQAL